MSARNVLSAVVMPAFFLAASCAGVLGSSLSRRKRKAEQSSWERSCRWTRHPENSPSRKTAGKPVHLRRQ